MAWFGGVVYYFSWVIIHNIKHNHVDYYHIGGFWNCSMHVRNKYGVKIYTWDETPCRSTGPRPRDVAWPWNGFYCGPLFFRHCGRIILTASSPSVEHSMLSQRHLCLICIAFTEEHSMDATLCKCGPHYLLARTRPVSYGPPG